MTRNIGDFKLDTRLKNKLRTILSEKKHCAGAYFEEIDRALAAPRIRAAGVRVFVGSPAATSNMVYETRNGGTMKALPFVFQVWGTHYRLWAELVNPTA